MKQYIDLVKHIRENGHKRQDRTDTGTLSVFGYQTRFDLTEGFPAVTVKKLFLRSVIYELLWFLKGSTNISYLSEHKVPIWNEWADKDGNLGPVYGKQWRSWPKYDGECLDQIAQVIHDIKHNPYSRRLIVSAWNVAQVEQMALPPCHVLFQFYVDGDNLSLQLYQRSADVFLGVPFNIASYSLLLMMIAQVTGLKAKEFVYTLGDAHLYLNHLEQVDLMLTREPMPHPIMKINPDVKNIDDFTYEDFQLIGYKSHDAIRAPIAV